MLTPSGWPTKKNTGLLCNLRKYKKKKKETFSLRKKYIFF